MARKKVIDLNADKVVGFGDKKDQKKPGQEVSGYYLGNRTVQTEMGPSVLHVLQLPDGSSLGLWGSAQLNGKLAQVTKGTMVFIKYVKKIKVPKGTMKVFEVEYDDEETIHVQDTEINFQAGDTGEADADDGSQGDGSEAGQEVEEQEGDPDASEGSEPEQEEEQAPPAKLPPKKPAAAAPSPDARARAAAMLNKKR